MRYPLRKTASNDCRSRGRNLKFSLISFRESTIRWRNEVQREKKKKIRKKEKKEFKFNELFVNEVARKQRVMRFEGFSRRKEARFSYLE